MGNVTAMNRFIALPKFRHEGKTLVAIDSIARIDDFMEGGRVELKNGSEIFTILSLEQITELITKNSKTVRYEPNYHQDPYPDKYMGVPYFIPGYSPDWPYKVT